MPVFMPWLRNLDVALFIGSSILLSFTANASSTCYGTPKSGHLKDGLQLPKKGKNFEVYSGIGHALGRTYVHDKVHAVIVNSYAELAQRLPEVIYVIGETGWKEGGRFRPHKTHQNGLSADFMVPVRNRRNKSVPLPTPPWKKFGYAIEFDRQGNYEDLRIDFEAIAAHLIVLHSKAEQSGIKIDRVIFDPDLTELLKASKTWSDVRPNVHFSPHKPWVRHDEHYHIDFAVPCSP